MDLSKLLLAVHVAGHITSLEIVDNAIQPPPYPRHTIPLVHSYLNIALDAKTMLSFSTLHKIQHTKLLYQWLAFSRPHSKHDFFSTKVLIQHFSGLKIHEFQDRREPRKNLREAAVQATSCTSATLSEQMTTNNGEPRIMLPQIPCDDSRRWHKINTHTLSFKCSSNRM